MPCIGAMSEVPEALKLWLWVDRMFLDLLICLVGLLCSPQKGVASSSVTSSKYGSKDDLFRN